MLWVWTWAENDILALVKMKELHHSLIAKVTKLDRYSFQRIFWDIQVFCFWDILALNIVETKSFIYLIMYYHLCHPLNASIKKFSRKLINNDFNWMSQKHLFVNSTSEMVEPILEKGVEPYI